MPGRLTCSLCSLCLTVLTICLSGGCASRIPEGFPKTVPCTIVVTDDGKPLEGALVVITTVPPSNSLSIAAKTDLAGKAVIRTLRGSYSAPGIPVGKVVMTLNKQAAAPEVKTSEQVEALTPEQIDAMTSEEQAAYQRRLDAETAKLPRLVPEKLTRSDMSPLTRDIAEGQAVEWIVDIAEYRKR